MEFQVTLFTFTFFLFTFYAFLRGHYPEQVHRVISQLQAAPAFRSPGLSKFFSTSYNRLGNS